MDPMDLLQLRQELRRASTSYSTPVRAENLYPGLVIAGGLYDRHVIIHHPRPIDRMVSLTVRHVTGGHTLTLRRSRTTEVAVYPQRLHMAYLTHIPEIPNALIPGDPRSGDRVAYVRRDNPTSLGVSGRWIYQNNGLGWERDGKALNPRESARDSHGFTSGGWFVFLPADHARAHLYLDGLPTPARTVSQLSPGDVLREHGGGRHVVRKINPQINITTVEIEVLQLTDDPNLTQVPNARAVGDRLELMATPTSLYPVEARMSEYIRAGDIREGDVVITAYGQMRSSVCRVDEIVRRALSPGVRLRVTEVDDRPRTLHVDGSNAHFVLLHRPRVQSQQATA